MRYMCNSCGKDVGGPDVTCVEHPAARINVEPDACARLYIDRAAGFRRILLSFHSNSRFSSAIAADAQRMGTRSASR